MVNLGHISIFSFFSAFFTQAKMNENLLENELKHEINVLKLLYNFTVSINSGIKAHKTVLCGWGGVKFCGCIVKQNVVWL